MREILALSALITRYSSIQPDDSISSYPNPQPNVVILCVDDDSAILNILKWTLEKEGFSVLTATNWGQAQDAFRKNPVDLVLLDYELQCIRGDEIAIGIRSINPAAPIILHSGAPSVPEIALKITDAFIPKGVESYILIGAISNLIMKRRATDIRTSELVPKQD